MPSHATQDHRKNGQNQDLDATPTSHLLPHNNGAVNQNMPTHEKPRKAIHRSCIIDRILRRSLIKKMYRSINMSDVKEDRIVITENVDR